MFLANQKKEPVVCFYFFIFVLWYGIESVISINFQKCWYSRLRLPLPCMQRRLEIDLHELFVWFSIQANSFFHFGTYQYLKCSLMKQQNEKWSFLHSSDETKLKMDLDRNWVIQCLVCLSVFCLELAHGALLGLFCLLYHDGIDFSEPPYVVDSRSQDFHPNNDCVGEFSLSFLSACFSWLPALWLYLFLSR